MKKYLISLLAIFLIEMQVSAAEKTIKLELTNNWKLYQTDTPIAIKLNQIKTTFAISSAVVMDGELEIPCQLDDLDNDHRPDELAFVIDMPAHSTKEVSVTFYSDKPQKAYKPRVYAMMMMRDVKKGKHQPIQSLTVPGTSNVYNFVFPHGPAFESELVAYRVYFNQKQTLDPYGKYHKRLELEESGFYPNDEQLSNGFGDDVLRVFNSCGPGTLKGWNGTTAIHITDLNTRTERIVSYGPIRTIVEVIDEGWNYQNSQLTMTTRYILYAGHRDVEVNVFFEKPLNNEIFCTGVQRIVNSKSYSDHQGLIACWGTDWPVNDTVKYAKETVGLATCIPQKYVQKETSDPSNLLYLIKAPRQQSFTYHLMFTAAKETFGYKTAEEWFAYARLWKEGLESPCLVRIHQ